MSEYSLADSVGKAVSLLVEVKAEVNVIKEVLIEKGLIDSQSFEEKRLDQINAIATDIGKFVTGLSDEKYQSAIEEKKE